MELIYNGQTFNATSPARRFARPGAINWRYQVNDEALNAMPIEAPRKPLESGPMNWRYQVPTGK